MGSQPPRERLEPRRKLLRRFYEPLLLLNALGSIRGERIKPERYLERDELNHRRARRSFADGIAYICAYRKGPEQVTAVCLESKPHAINVLLAANKHVGEEVCTFLRDILSDLSYIGRCDGFSSAKPENSAFVERLTTKVIVFNKARIQQYYKDIWELLPACLDILQSSSRSTTALETWLQENFVSDLEENQTIAEFVNSCYAARKKSLFDCLKPFSGQGETRFQDFERLFKLLYKLSKHVAVVKQLVQAVTLLPQDFGRAFDITVIPSSPARGLPLKRSETRVESTANRAFSNVNEKEQFLDRLRSVWDTDELSRLQQEEITTKTRVHAEILIIDYIDINGCEFLDGDDRYIGCSKPACYLCYAYIKIHPGRYALPASHQKLYVGWRPHDIYSSDPNAQGRLIRQEKLIQRLAEQIRKDLSAEIESRSPRRPYHADSTAGITTTVAEETQDVPQLEYHPLQNNHSSFIAQRHVERIAIRKVIVEESSEDEGGVLLG